MRNFLNKWIRMRRWQLWLILGCQIATVAFTYLGGHIIVVFA